MTVIDVQLVTDEEKFCALQSDWNDLLCHINPENPFQSHQWLLSWWQVFGSGKLYVIVCRCSDTGELLGALPLYLKRKWGLFDSLYLLGSGQGCADFIGCIAREGHEQQVYRSVLEKLLKNKSSWDIIDLDDMDADAPFARFLRCTELAKFAEERDPEKRCPYLKLPNTWEDLLKGLSSKNRQRIGNRRRALEKAHDLEFELITSEAKLPDALDMMFRLRQDRMEQKGISSAEVTNDYRKFHSLLAKRFLEVNRLRLYFLKLDGNRIAYLYLFFGGNTHYFYQTGFNKDYSKQSVGFVALSLLIERSVMDGNDTFEFLRGYEDYKYNWGVVSERCLCRMTLYNSSICSSLSSVIAKTAKLAKKLIKYT